MIVEFLPIWAQALIAVVVGIAGAARLTRLVVHDSFPPALWFRQNWERWTKGSTWNPLFLCHWCFGFWATVFVAGWFALGLAVTWIAWTWWVVIGLLGTSYLTSWIVEHDDDH